MRRGLQLQGQGEGQQLWLADPDGCARRVQRVEYHVCTISQSRGHSGLLLWPSGIPPLTPCLSPPRSSASCHSVSPLHFAFPSCAHNLQFCSPGFQIHTYSCPYPPPFDVRTTKIVKFHQRTADNERKDQERCQSSFPFPHCSSTPDLVPPDFSVQLNAHRDSSSSR